MQLNYFGYFNNTGYSVAAQDYIFALLHAKPDLDLRLHCVNKKMGPGMSKNRVQFFTSLEQSNKTESDPSTYLYHSIPPRYRRPPGKAKYVGLCVFETINVPVDWVSTMNNMDTIVTASEFNANIFETSGVKVPIHIVPHCFDPKMFNRDTKCLGRYSQVTFVSCGAWKKRKNWETLIKSWYEAFEARDNVCLLIKTDNPPELTSIVRRIKQDFTWRSKNTAPIYCEEKPICDFEDIPGFLRKGDIYICPSLGEGFGLSGLHAMALGIPVITTRFGGALEYAKPDLCTYLEPKKYVRIANMDGIPQLSNCIWPHIEYSEIAKKMRHVLGDVKEREQKTQRAYSYVHDNFSYETIGQKLLDVLEIN